MSKVSHHIKTWSETKGFYFPVDTASTTPESLTSPIPAGPAKRGVKMTQRITTEIAPTFCSGAALKIIQVHRHGGGKTWRKKNKYVMAVAGVTSCHLEKAHASSPRLGFALSFFHDQDSKALAWWSDQNTSQYISTLSEASCPKTMAKMIPLYTFTT